MGRSEATSVVENQYAHFRFMEELVNSLSTFPPLRNAIQKISSFSEKVYFVPFSLRLNQSNNSVVFSAFSLVLRSFSEGGVSA